MWLLPPVAPFFGRWVEGWGEESLQVDLEPWPGGFPGQSTEEQGVGQAP